MRNILIVVVAAAVSLTGGVAGTAQFYGSQVRAQAQALLQAQHRVEVLEDATKAMTPDLEAAQEQAARLQNENVSLSAELGSLRTEVEQLKASVPEHAAASAPVEADADTSALLDGMLDAASTPGKEPESAGRRHRKGAPTPEEEAVRQQRMAEFRQQADDYFAAAVASAPTEEARQRLEDIDSSRKNLFELRAAMRDAKTDEERSRLEEEADSERQTLQQLTREQQRDMLRTVGQSYGIKDSDLPAFQKDMRSVMEDPMFRFGAFMGGRGPGKSGAFGGNGGGGRNAGQ